MKGGMPLNRKKVLRVILVIITVLLVFVAGYTFAKYITEVDGAGSAKVAKWSFVANAGQDEITDIKLEDTVNKMSLVDGKIAPGTGGNFDIVIDGTGSEVSIDYSVEVVSEVNIPDNLRFGIDGEECTYSSLAALVDERLQNGRINYDTDQYVVHTISWQWPYESDDDYADTLDGEAALDYSFGLKITGVQAQLLMS